MFERIAHDVRFAVRSLRRSPGFALTTILVLALGIGANTAVFSVARGVLLEPLPYPEPDRLVQFVSRTQAGRSTAASVPKFNAWREGLPPVVSARLAAYYGGGPGVTLSAGDRREHLDAMYVSSAYFRVFGAPVARGRTFRASEDAPQGAHVAVISQALANREFGIAVNPVGRLLTLGETSHEIVGVLGAAFRPIPAADIWLPLQAPRISFNHTNYLTVVARLPGGITVERVDEQARATTRRFRATFPGAMASEGCVTVEAARRGAGDLPALTTLTPNPCP